MLRKLYEDLLAQDYWPIKIYPLLNLYEKYQGQGKTDKFFEFLEKISSDYETDQIKELILCEEENIDIDFMTQEFAPAEKMKEIRLFLMENNKEKEAYEIAQEFFGYWTSSQIAVVRKFRILKGECPMIIRKEIDFTQPLAPSQIEMLHNLETKPVFLDEDCPELTVEQLAQFVKHSDSE